jgi:hypothetical protein
MQILRIATWPPKWWGLWWPRPLRRSGDLWPFLPTSTRLTRTTLTAFFVLLPLLIYGGRWARTAGALGSRGEVVHRWFTLTEYGLVLLTVMVVAASAWLWQRRGVPTPDVAWLLVGPTIESRFWARPQIAALLDRPGGARASDAEQPQTPHDYLRGISDSAELLAGSARALGSDAVAAARQLVNGIEALDKEITTLARDVDPAEVSRLEQRLFVIDETATDDDEQQMRVLLERQLELLRRLAARLESATAQRARHIGMLRTLALYVANLRAQTAEESLESGEVTSQIRALCVAIEHHGVPAGSGVTAS